MIRGVEHRADLFDRKPVALQKLRVHLHMYLSLQSASQRRLGDPIDLLEPSLEDHLGEVLERRQVALASDAQRHDRL